MSCDTTPHTAIRFLAAAHCAALWWNELTSCYLSNPTAYPGVSGQTNGAIQANPWGNCKYGYGFSADTRTPSIHLERYAYFTVCIREQRCTFLHTAAHSPAVRINFVHGFQIANFDKCISHKGLWLERSLVCPLLPYRTDARDSQRGRLWAVCAAGHTER